MRTSSSYNSGMPNCTNHPTVSEQVFPCFRCQRSFCADCRIEIQGQLYCAACKNEQIRDIQSGVDSTRLDLASVGRRFAALCLDGLILGVPTAVIIIVMIIAVTAAVSAMEGGDDNPIAIFLTLMVFALAMLVIFGVNIAYEALMLAARGQTLGKMALKIKVVTAEGADISRGQAWGRSAIRVVLAQVVGPINYVPALFTKDKTCLHDMIARTRVVNWLV